MTDDQIQQEVAEILATIEEAKETIGELKGRIAAEEETLKREFGVNTLAEGKKLYSKLNGEIDSLREKRNALYSELQNEINW